MTSLLRPSFLLLTLLTLLTGVLYPTAVTGAAQLLIRRQAHGSLLVRQGVTVGSELIGQPFSDPEYFWPRPSATGPFAYNPGSSGGANLGPTNPVLLAAVAERVAALRATGITGPVPADLVLASASGLDPHITPAGARAQVARVAQARSLKAADLERFVASRIEAPQLGILGEPRVNVLELNLALDERNRNHAGTDPHSSAGQGTTK